MWTNLFELLDGLFRGIIYFFYNFVETAYRVIRHPTTGPLLLFKRHRNPAQRQIGGLTFLFLSFFLLFSLFALAVQSSNARTMEALSQTLSDLPNLGMTSLWPTVAGALLATVMVDAPMRLLLWWRVPRNRLRREIILGSVHYAIFLPVLFAMAGMLASFTLMESLALNSLSWVMVVLTAMLVVTGLVAGWAMRPAAGLLGKAFHGRRRSRAGAVGRVVAMTSLLAAAIFAGAMATFALKSESEDQARAERYLRIVALRCILDDRTFTVEAVVWNPSREPAVVEPKFIDVEVGKFTRQSGFDRTLDVRSYDIAWTEPGEDLIILKSGDILRLRGQSISFSGTWSRDDRCLLDGSSSQRIAGSAVRVDDPRAKRRPWKWR